MKFWSVLVPQQGVMPASLRAFICVGKTAGLATYDHYNCYVFRAWQEALESLDPLLPK
jgi:hypothetical protein